MSLAVRVIRLVHQHTRSEDVNHRLGHGGTLEGLGAWWHVTDNGEGPNDPPDITTFLGVGSLAATQAFCDNRPAYRFPFAIQGGNIQVRPG